MKRANTAPRKEDVEKRKAEKLFLFRLYYSLRE
jgi:hypothetical protein